MLRFIASILNRISTKINKTASFLYMPLQKMEVARWKNDNGDKTLAQQFTINENSIVFDVGGYEGQWASDIFSRYLCKIYIFEPVKLYSSRIKDRFIRNNRIAVFPFGLSDKTEAAHISILEEGSSLFRSGENMEIVQLKNIIEFIHEQSIESIDLMKINIEGGEYPLLTLLIKDGFHKKIRNILVQFHQISPESRQRMENLRADLLKTHSLTFCYDFVWENWKLNS